MELFTPSPNRELGRSVLHLEIEDIFNRLIEDCYSDLKNYAFIRPLKGDAHRDYGDYVCLSVLEICEELRKKDPDLFDQKTPRAIAREILRELPYEGTTAMIDGRSLLVHDAGIITFQLDRSWIVNRISLMLTNGIHTLAPIIYKRTAKAVFVSTTNNMSSIRATWIKDALLRMFLYSGLDVFDDIVSADLETETETIWRGVCKLRADIMVFVIPQRQREYIQGCFNDARRSNWFRRGGRQAGQQEATLACCGYRSSDQEINQLDIRQEFFHDYFIGEARVAGYTPDAFLGCLLKYTLLKSHRLANVTFNIEEMVDKKGNTLVNLLRTKAKIHLVTKYSKSSSASLTETAVLASNRERKLGLHIVEFTRVIETACRGLVPHVVCEYLFDLSKLFMSYYRETCRGVRPSQATVFLCQASEVVMCECFRLLGIDPSCEQATSVPFLSSVERPIKETWANDDRYSQSRFELVTMVVNVPHPDFDKGSIFGNIWVKDANGERADGWTMSNDKDYCFVSYFNHEWHKPLDISYGSLIPFGNPSCRRSVSVSSSFEVDVVLHALNKNKDRCYLVFHGKHEEPLSKFWDEEPKAQCGTLELESDVGRVLLNYILLKNAVDASMQMTFMRTPWSNSNPAVPVRISGSILACYEDPVVKEDGGILGRCKAVIFRPKEFELIGEQGVLPLHKSLLAVPANGYLKIEAFLMDVVSRKVIVRDTKDFHPGPGKSDHNWCIKGEGCSFNLRVAWSL